MDVLLGHLASPNYSRKGSQEAPAIRGMSRPGLCLSAQQWPLQTPGQVQWNLQQQSEPRLVFWYQQSIKVQRSCSLSTCIFVVFRLCTAQRAALSSPSQSARWAQEPTCAICISLMLAHFLYPVIYSLISTYGFYQSQLHLKYDNLSSVLSTWKLLKFKFLFFQKSLQACGSAALKAFLHLTT